MALTAAERQRRYRAAHPERAAEIKRRYYIAHQEEQIAASRARYAAHREENQRKARIYQREHKAERRERDKKNVEQIREYHRKWRATNIKKARAAYRKWRDEHKEQDRSRVRAMIAHRVRILRDIQRDMGCSKCGYNGDSMRMCFHHVDPTTKSFGIWERRMAPWSVLRPEFAKCIVLCNSCHTKLHHQLRKEARANGC